MKEEEVYKNFIKENNGYYVKENNKYVFLPFEKFYSLEELLEITRILNKLNNNE